MKQTSAEWLFEKLWETPKDKLTWHSILEQAKQMENKHTAVQWLVEKIQQANPSFKFDSLIRQAKQMEKQEIINAYKQGQHDSEPIRPTDAEQYYNQTYKPK